MVFYLLSASLGPQRSGPLLVKQGPLAFTLSPQSSWGTPAKERERVVMKTAPPSKPMLFGRQERFLT